MEFIITIFSIIFCFQFLGELSELLVNRRIVKYLLFDVYEDSFTINKNKTIIHNYSSKQNNWTKVDIYLKGGIIEIDGSVLNYKYCWMYATYTYFTTAKKVRKFIRTIEIDKLPVY